MSDNLNDVSRGPQKNPNKKSMGQKAKDAAGKAASAAKNFKKYAHLFKNLGLLFATPVGWILLIIIAIIIFVLFLIGAVSFLQAMPGQLMEKIGDFAEGIMTELSSVIVGNEAYITDEDQLELAQYLESMGYTTYEYGFGKYEDTTDDDAEPKINSRYLSAYLLADYNTYCVRSNFKKGLGDFLRKFTGFTNPFLFGEFITEDTDKYQYGMLNFVDGMVFDGIEIEAVQKDTNKLVVSVNRGFLWLTEDFYTYDMEGWSTRYGKPLELMLTLHLATMAPDLAYHIAMDPEENTSINIKWQEVTLNIKYRYQIKEGNADGIADADESLESLRGKTELSTEDLKKIQEVLNKQVVLYEAESEVVPKLDEYLETFPNYGLDYTSLMSMGIESTIVNFDSQIDDMKEQISERLEDEKITEDEKSRLEGITFHGGTPEDGDGYYYNSMIELNELMNDNFEIGSKIYNAAIETMDDDGNISSDFNYKDHITSEEQAIIDQILNKLKTIRNNFEEDLQKLKDEASRMENSRIKLDEALSELGLSEESINQAIEQNNQDKDGVDQGTEVKTIVPYIQDVTKHWFRDVIFIGEVDPEDDIYDEEQDGLVNAYSESEGEVVREYEFHPSTDDSASMGGSDKGSYIVTETRPAGIKTQIYDAVRGEVNEHTKELFVGKNDDSTGTKKKPKYFIYDGSTETADEIERLRQIETENRIAGKSDEEVEAAIEAEDKNNVYREISFDKNALSAFSILEGMKSEDADFILRDLKELLVELKYFTREELREKETEVLHWLVPDYMPEIWPDREFEKQNYDYGTLIRSKTSMDNLKQGKNADGSERTEDQKTKDQYPPNTNPEVSTTSPEDEPGEPVEPEEGEAQEIIPTGYEPEVPVVSPATGEVLEVGSDFIRIKILDTDKVKEYKEFYKEYEDICEGYELYIEGFKTTEINDETESRYERTKRSDKWYIQNSYTKEEKEKMEEEEDIKNDAPVYIEVGGKKYIKEGTIIGETTGADIRILLRNRDKSIVENVESYIKAPKKKSFSSDWAYFYWIPYESGGIDGAGNGPEAVGWTTSNELAVGISQWTTINKDGKYFNNISEFCAAAIELNPGLCSELQPFVNRSVEEILASKDSIQSAFQSICAKDRDGFLEVQMQVTINQYLIEPYTGTDKEWLLEMDPVTQGTFMSLVNWNGNPSTWFAVFDSSDSDDAACKAMLTRACPIGSTAGNLSHRWNSQYVLARDILNGTVGEEDLENWIKTKQPWEKYGEGKNPGVLGY